MDTCKLTKYGVTDESTRRRCHDRHYDGIPGPSLVSDMDIGLIADAPELHRQFGKTPMAILKVLQMAACAPIRLPGSRLSHLFGVFEGP